MAVGIIWLVPYGPTFIKKDERKSFFITSSKNIELGIVERYVSNVFYSERIVRVFYSQSDKILGVFYPK